MKSILGIGNALCDILTPVNDEDLKQLGLPKGSTQFVDLDGYHRLREKLEHLDTTLASGGSIGNSMLALANLGCQPRFIGKIGNDRYGDFYKDHFQRHGGTPHFLVGELPTGVATTFITPDGQRTFDDYLGAAATLTAQDLQPDWFEQVDIFYIEGYLVQNHDLLLHAIELAKQRHLTIALDFGSYNIVSAEHTFFEKILPDVDIIFANEDEAYTFSKTKDPLQALHCLNQYCDIAVVKLGERGAMAKSKDDFAQMAAITVDHVIDTTGAGDYFAAGFLYGYSMDEPLSACLRKGIIMGSKVIQVVGTTLQQDTWDEIRTQL